MRSRTVYLQHSRLPPQMWSGLPKYMRTSAHDSWQVLTFKGKTCSLGRSFTSKKAAPGLHSIQVEDAIVLHLSRGPLWCLAQPAIHLLIAAEASKV